MATLTFGASPGNWQTDAAWVGGVKPTSADDCLLTSASGACTIDSGAVCRSLNLTGYTSTLTHNAAVTLTIGDATAGLSNVALEFPASGWTYTLGNATTSAITFVSTSATQQTVNFGGKQIGDVTYNATSNGSWLYTGEQLIGSNTTTMALTKGSLNTNGYAVTTGKFNSNNTNVRSLTLGTSIFTITGTGSSTFDINSVTNLTFSGASSTINFTGIGPSVNGGGLTYGIVTFACRTPTLNGANTFTTLNVTSTSGAGKTGSLTLVDSQVVTGTLTLAGNSIMNRLLVTSSILGTTRTLTAAVVTASHVDLRDIAGAGAASWDLSAITGGSGNCGGNSLKALGDAAFTTAATQTATGTASFVWSTHGWTSRVPLPQDDVVINNAFIAGRTVTLDMPRAGKSISFAGATGTPTLNFNIATTIYGSLTKIAGMLHTGAVGTTFEGRGAFTLTNGGIAWPSGSNVFISMFNGSLTLQDAFISASALTHNNGNLVDAGFATTFTTITSISGFTRTLTRSGSLTLTGTGAVLTYTGTGLTYIGTGSSITINETTQGTSKTFAGGGLTGYGALILSGKNIILTGANTFASIALNNLGDTVGVTLPAGVTTTALGAVTSTASAGNVAKLISSSAGTPARLSSGSAIISLDYLSLKDSAAMGVASWYAGANSTNVSGNTGWTFAAPTSVWGAPTFFPRRIAYGSPVNWRSPLTRGLAGWWMVLPKRYGGARHIDLLGRSHGTLTNMGASSATSGWGATARPGGYGELRFDGTNDYDTFSISAVPFAVTGFSIAFWVKRGGSGTNGLVSWADGPTSGTPFAFLRNTAGVLDWYFGGNYTLSHGTIADNVWTHLFLTWDATTVLLTSYINGISIATVGRAETNSSGATKLIFGNGFSGYALMCMDDALLYRRAMTGQEVRMLYEESRTFHPRMLRRVGGGVAGGVTESGFQAAWARHANQAPFGGGVLV